VLKVHPSNYRIDGFVEDTPVSELATLGLPVVVDIGSGLLDANVPWLAGPPPAWLAGEPAAVQTLADGAGLVTFSGDKLLGGPQAGVIAGRADLVAACAAHPLARALRPGGLVLGSLQDVALAYLRRDAAVTIPFWRMVGASVTALRARAVRMVTEAGVGEAVATEALPGAGSAPGVTMPSYGVAIDGDHLARLRVAPTPIVGRVHDQRTYLDLRGVDPEDDAALVHALRAITPR
jgi:L-seryl-tRNA(Ser) seleniumtransferase